MLVYRVVLAVRVLSLAVALALWAGASWAQTASESFEYTSGIVPGNGGSGWVGPWVSNQALVVVPGLTHTSLAGSGNALGPTPGSAATRVLASPIVSQPGVSLVLRALVGSSIQGTSVSQATLGNSGGGTFIIGDLPMQAPQAKNWGLQNVAGTFYSAIPVAPGTTLLVAQIDFEVSSANDRMRLWVDPPPNHLTATPAIDVTNAHVSSFSGIFWQTQQGQIVDEIRISALCPPGRTAMIPKGDLQILKVLGIGPSLYPEGVLDCDLGVDVTGNDPTLVSTTRQAEDATETWALPPGYEKLIDLPIEPTRPRNTNSLGFARRIPNDAARRAPNEVVRDSLDGWADLHTHMFAELAWPVSGSNPFIEGTVEGPMGTALARCSGTMDHATIKPGYGSAGLGITSESLTGVGGTLAFAFGGASHGDSGLHLTRRNGFDTRKCQFACRGPLGCLGATGEAACLAAHLSQCKDDIPNNLSLSALAACNSKPSQALCTGSGYCGAENSSLWSVADDLSPCWAHWPNCDNGDMCLKRNPLKSLACNDLTHSECGQHSKECNWEEGCRWHSGMLECNDLSQTECNHHSSECNWEQGCKWDSGMLECNDLSQAECGDHSKSCSWSKTFKRCYHPLQKSSLECNDLSSTECGNHSECHWQSGCRHPLTAPSLECNDLASSECSNHQSECRWEAECKHRLNVKALECSDLTLAECANHFNDGGCGARNCTRVDCHWEEGCHWDPLLPLHCGDHFRDWPAWDTPTHQQHWWGWVQDAYRRGLRVLSVSILEVHPLSKLFPGFSRLPHDVILDQLDAAHAFVANHSSWVEIALSPAHARTIIQQGKLALFLTLEGEFPFCTQEPCGQGPDEEDITKITATLDEYYARGLRGMQVVSHFDNPYGGVANYTKGIHSMQWLYEELTADGVISWSDFTSAAGPKIPLIDAAVAAVLLPYTGGAGPVSSQYPVIGFGNVNDIHAIAAVMGNVAGNSCVGRGSTVAVNCAECLSPGSLMACDNVYGLSPLGQKLVAELKKRHMLIDLSHISDRGAWAIDAFLKTLPAGAQYPLYISHGDPRAALRPLSQHLGHGGDKGPHQEKPTPDSLLEMIRSRGGMFGVRTGPDEFVDVSSKVANNCAGSTKSFAQSLTYVVDRKVPVGFALDMNGMIQNAAPRFSDHTTRGKHAACLGNTPQQAMQANPVADDPATPFTNERDFNTKGLAHIGLLGAFMDDLRNNGLSTAYLTALEGSAEQFVQMWELAQ